MCDLDLRSVQYVLGLYLRDNEQVTTDKRINDKDYYKSTILSFTGAWWYGQGA